MSQLNFTPINEAWAPIKKTYVSPTKNVYSPQTNNDDENEKNIVVSNPKLKEFFKSNPESAEMIIYDLLSNNPLSDLTEKIDSIYTIVIGLCILVIIDMMFHYNKH